MENRDLLRYTELPALIHSLKRREITLLDPRFWDDKNDSSFIDLYRQKRGLKSVLALCFARSEETYHHWRVFAPSSSGVRLHFDEIKLRAAICGVEGLQFRDVQYLTIKDLRDRAIDTNDLPFLKRYPFQPERECRLLWESRTEELPFLGLGVPLSVISRVTLSPWLHPSLVNDVKATIKGIAGCSKLKVYRSTLISNADWLAEGERAA